MAVSAVPRRSSQLPLFARPQCNPHWTDLSSDVQQQIVRLLAQLLRQHRERAAEGTAQEAHGE
jgi:acyl-CoA reductase-like NAD-dependent aldehyde dehydrogenase